jgi:hypothetical protein
MSMRLKSDSNGQLSIDFLLGVTIFIMAFLFLFIAIPSLFTPFQSNSDELTMIADRVGAMLVESEFAMTSDTGEPMPGIANMSKVKDLDAILNDGTGGLEKRKSLGLDNGNTVYHLQVIFEKCNNTNETVTRIAIPNNDEPGNQNVGQSRRFVLLRDPTLSTLSSGDPNYFLYYPGIKTVMVVRVW